ncbi:YebC-like protein [Melanogaster broomeanus]|nr:YebC-like protein [Melanogaster broomeanus]
MFSRGLLQSRFTVPGKHVPLRTLSTTQTRFSGHSKWSKIKHRKGLEDAKKSKIYGKAARLVAPRTRRRISLLATAMRRAKDAGVPKENIENALTKAERTQGNGQAMLFEAMLNGKTGIIMAHTTPVKFMFQQRGYVKVQIGDDMETLLDQIMNVCSIDFADWSEESGQRGVGGVHPSIEPHRFWLTYALI